MAAELVHRDVSLIVAGGGVETAPAAKAATSTIPIVFILGVDPVAVGLVKSLARPEGNITGVSFLTAALGPKRLGLLIELVPKVKLIGLLLNSKNPSTETQATELTSAAATRGLQIKVIEAGSQQELETLAIPADIEALIVSPDPFFTSRHAELTSQVTQRHCQVAKRKTIFSSKPFGAELTRHAPFRSRNARLRCGRRDMNGQRSDDAQR